MSSLKLLLISIFLLVLGAIGRLLLAEGYIEALHVGSFIFILLGIILGIVGCIMPAKK